MGEEVIRLFLAAFEVGEEVVHAAAKSVFLGEVVVALEASVGVRGAFGCLDIGEVDARILDLAPVDVAIVVGDVDAEHLAFAVGGRGDGRGVGCGVVAEIAVEKVGKGKQQGEQGECLQEEMGGMGVFFLGFLFHGSGRRDL